MAASGTLVASVLLASLLSSALGQNHTVQVSDICLGCICEAVSSCTANIGCEGDVCGLFRITWGYWTDAGKPVIPQDDPKNDGAYARCATDIVCAATTVRSYMSRFAQDCNGDQQINCYDFAAIHRLGGYGCSGNVDYNYYNKFNQCMQQVQQLSG